MIELFIFDLSNQKQQIMKNYFISENKVDAQLDWAKEWNKKVTFGTTKCSCGETPTFHIDGETAIVVICDSCYHDAPNFEKYV